MLVVVVVAVVVVFAADVLFAVLYQRDHVVAQQFFTTGTPH